MAGPLPALEFLPLARRAPDDDIAGLIPSGDRFSIRCDRDARQRLAVFQALAAGLAGRRIPEPDRSV